MSEQSAINEASTQPKDHPRCATGIDGLDGILNGGVPVGNTVLVVGSCGSGKTTLSIEVLVNGAKSGENSAYLAATEPAGRVIENMRTYDFFDEKLLEEKKLVFFDLDILYDRLGLDKEEFTSDDVNALVGAIEDIVRHLKLKRLVIDSMTALSFSLKTKEKIRDFMLKLGRALAESGCTVFLISEIPPGSVQYSAFGVEDMIADGVISLGNIEQRGYLLRTINVVKMRGTVHSRSKFVMDLTPQGILIVPLLRTGL